MLDAELYVLGDWFCGIQSRIFQTYPKFYLGRPPTERRGVFVEARRTWVFRKVCLKHGPEDEECHSIVFRRALDLFFFFFLWAAQIFKNYCVMSHRLKESLS